MVDWKPKARAVAAAIFFLAAAFVLAKTGRDALFVQERGLYDLPKAYIGIAILSGPLAFAMLALLKAFGARRVRLILPLATALALIAFSFVVRPGGGALMTFFFMFIPLIWGVVFSVSWLLAADLLDGASREHAAQGFSLVGGGAIFGGVAAGALARFVAPLVEPKAFLWLSALGLAVGAAVMAAAQRRYPPIVARTDEATTESPSKGLLQSSYTRALLAVGVAAAVVGVFVEFQFYVAASLSERAGREQAAFFASFYLVLNLAAFVVQVWVLPRVLRRVGVGGALLVLPVALVGGAAGLAASASVLAVSVVRVAEGGLKSSIHRASWEQAYLPLAKSERAQTKIYVDGMAMRLAEGLAALMLLAWLYFVVGDSDLRGASALWLTPFLMMGSLAWLASARKLMSELRRRGVEVSRDAHGPPSGG